MATNEVFDKADTLYEAVPSGTVSGDPVCVGQIPGVALIDRDADGKATITRRGAHLLSVAAIDNSGTAGADANVAVAVGDILYFAIGDTPKLSKRNDGIRYGYADQAITSGATATIRVILGY